jgi:hypothetical protein
LPNPTTAAAQCANKGRARPVLTAESIKSQIEIVVDFCVVKQILTINADAAPSQSRGQSFARVRPVEKSANKKNTRCGTDRPIEDWKRGTCDFPNPDKKSVCYAPQPAKSAVHHI